uniref:PPPDE domain-containing protein n=1 Tax=Araucaria cunninghamii TaxID=56994 RepID=A0A0D6QRU7_ARACU
MMSMWSLLSKNLDSDSSRSSEESSNNNNNSSRYCVPLYLNVYDLTPLNNYLYWFGLGIFHTGIEAHGIEYAFGAHDYPASGVFAVQPKKCPGFIFRHSVLLGTITMSCLEFQQFMEQMARNYYGDSYHLITKNCNHFTEDVCMRLLNKPAPAWVNRLARLGAFCNCLLPESIQVTTVRQTAEYQGSSEDGSETRSIQDQLESDGEHNDEESESFMRDRLHDMPMKQAKDFL